VTAFDTLLLSSWQLPPWPNGQIPHQPKGLSRPPASTLIIICSLCLNPSYRIIMYFILVRYHVDRCTMYKRMIWTPTRRLFLPCTESLLYYPAHTIQNIMISECVLSTRKKYTLTWKGSPLLMVLNSHPHRSLAWSQLPLSLLALLTPRTRFLPTGHLFTYRWH
jgi:hypothetical protein